MTKTILLATTAFLLTAGTAAAQTPARAPAPQAETSQQGVLVFTPDFFADQRPNTALDMVSRVPGFSVQDGDGSRGFEGAVGNILINGSRPASKNDTGSSVLSRTLAPQVERIELIRGGAPGIDMQGYAVVVNVITRSQASTEQILTANMAFFEGGADRGFGQYQFTRRNGDRVWGFTLADGVAIDDSNGVGRVIRRDANGAILRDEGYYSDQTGGGQGVRVNFANAFMGGKIDLTARLGVNDYSQYSLQDGPGILRDNRFAEEGTSGEVGAVFTRSISEGLTSETRFIREWNDFENASTSRTTANGVASPEQRFASEGNASETILRSLIRWERSPSLTLEAGGELAYNMLEIDQALTVGGVGIPLPSDQIMVEETRGELFSKATWRMRPNLSVEGGLRLEASTITQSGDADQEKSFYYAKPRLQLTWTPRPQNQVRFRFERDVGQLDFGDFAAGADLEDEQLFGGNVDLEPEERWISELTYERRFLGDGIVSIGYRHDEIIGVIDRLPLPQGLSAVGNIGDGTLDQLAVNVLVPLDWTGFSGGQFQFRNTWNDTTVTDPTSGEERPISGIRPSQPAFTISQDITTWKINWAVTYLESLRQFRFDPDQVSGFTGSDYFEANIEYKPTPTLAIRAQVNVWNDFQAERTVFADRSAARPVAFTELRSTDPRTFWQIRIRKTF
ncbi:TonB-dependent siderophore receptor [Brevundimonas sp.]|uniref:TonB-dependent receptor plug domain-containing protein n=1 Tax=Brevundimonas sp. TaxID=1871086 RepID=UPI002731A1C8|nr:TonB-dependent receptor [Brevundimonas sp.]MDP1911952.1 TonB-dependent receptor [Brevundimonas sp.]